MNETYAFLAMFTIQVLAGSALCPALFIRRLRGDAASFPAERFAELFPGVDKIASTERFIARYRAQNRGIAVLGLLLLGWLINYLRPPGWSEDTVLLLIVVYMLAQMSPMFLHGRKAARHQKMLRTSWPDRKRKALLQRRGLFDFISPLAVSLAALSYLLVAALVIYIRYHPFPGSGGFINLGIVTLVYAFGAFGVFGSVYGKTRNPLATHAERSYATGVVVKTFVYTCVGMTVFTALDLTLGLLHLTQWGLFLVSAGLVICVLLPYRGAMPWRAPTGSGFSSDGPPPPGTRNLSV